MIVRQVSRRGGLFLRPGSLGAGVLYLLLIRKPLANSGGGKEEFCANFDTEIAWPLVSESLNSEGLDACIEKRSRF